MAVLVSEQGRVASWGGMGSEAETLLAAINPASFDLSVTGDEEDITTLAATAPTGRAFLPLRKSWTANLTGWLKGYHGGSTCTIASGGGEYDVHVQSFGLTITAGVVETTELGSADPDDKWKAFQPTIISTTATITAMVDSASALTDPPAFGATSLSTFTVTYKTGHTVAFTGFYTAVNLGSPNSGLQQVQITVRGSGAVTFVGVTTPLFSAGAYGGTPEYDDNSLVLTSTTGYTHTGSAFWSSIALQCDRNAATQVTIQTQGTGILTRAI